MQLNRVALGAILLFAHLANAQVPSSPTFEVASVKPSSGGSPLPRFDLPPVGDIRIVNGELRLIIMAAYGIQPEMVKLLLVGAADKVLAEKYDITAKASPGSKPGDNLLMLRTLLETRFALRSHTERRKMPVYELKVASASAVRDKLPQSTIDCPAFSASAAPAGAPKPTICQGADGSHHESR
jgi:uncharacterized protein (TIGR03435 family)